jgi:hypothetical protein
VTVFKSLGIPFKSQIIAFDSLKWGMLNLEGATLLSFQYGKRISEFKGITAFLKDNKWKIWDYEKSKLFSNGYDEIKLIEGDESTVLGFGGTKQKKYLQSIAFARIGEKWGVINHEGNILMPIEFERKYLYGKMKKL